MHEQIGLSPVNEMLYIKQLRPRLNVQTDSIHAKVFRRVFTTAVVSLTADFSAVYRPEFLKHDSPVHDSPVVILP